MLQDERVDPTADNNNILCITQRACRRVAKPVDPGAKQDYAIRLASKEGHLEVVRLLIKDELVAKPVDPAADDNFAIRRASEHGHVEVVRLFY